MAHPTSARAVSSAASRSAETSPRQGKFNGDDLRPYIKSLLSSTLQGVKWSSDKAQMASFSKEITQRIKQRMIDIEPRGFKYIVNATLSENLGQGGRADIACHWEQTDVVVQEVYSNDSIICACVAYAVQL